MRIIRLIAMREFMENVRTRGFWIGILIIPLIFIAMFFIQSRLADVASTRYYLIVDLSGRYRDEVEAAIDLEYQRQILTAFVSYLIANRKDGDPESSSTNSRSAADQLIDDVDTDEVAALNQWLENGGLEFALTMVSPYLKEGIQPFRTPERQLIEAPIPENINLNVEAAAIVEQLRPFLNGSRQLQIDGEPRELFALILIPGNVDSFIVRPGSFPVQPIGTYPGIQYWARNLTDTRLPDAIERSINTAIRNNEFANYGFNSQLVRNVQRTRMPLSKLDPQATAGEEEVSMADTFRQYAPVGFVYFLFIALMQSVQYLLSNTIEEKSNRIIEVLLASVTANELMMGKLLGILLSSLTTISVWLLSLIAFLNFYSSTETEIISQVLEVILGSELIPWFIFYCIAGYALFSGIFLAIGSLCNTLKEAQGLMMPVMLIIIVPIIMMPFVVLDPNNSLYRLMSWFPLFTPFLMMNRAAANPPLIDVVGTTVLLVLSIVFVLWMSGRVFRQGVLRTGQPPRLIELLRLLRNRH
jgi:ABC-2 type transport system permease protein